MRGDGESQKSPEVQQQMGGVWQAEQQERGVCFPSQHWGFSLLIAQGFLLLRVRGVWSRGPSGGNI